MAYLGKGFIPEKDDTYLKQLPKIFCFNSEEMTELIPRATKYLGNSNYSFGRPTVELKVVVRSEADFKILGEFFRTDVDRGSDWFHAQLLFFGIIDVFRCRFVTDFKEEVTDGVHWSHVKIEIDEFYNKLLDPGVNYVLTCGDLISCAEILECI